MDDVVYVGAPACEEHLKSRYLVFETNFDGDLDTYLTRLATETPEFVDDVWKHCVGYPGVTDVDAFIAYMKKCQIEHHLLLRRCQRPHRAADSEGSADADRRSRTLSRSTRASRRPNYSAIRRAARFHEARSPLPAAGVETVNRTACRRRTARMSTIDVSDIQGFALKGYNFPYARYLLLELLHHEAARKFIDAPASLHHHRRALGMTKDR